MSTENESLFAGPMVSPEIVERMFISYEDSRKYVFNPDTEKNKEEHKNV